MNLSTYIPPLSAHPNSCFKGLITGEILRYWSQNSNKQDFISIASQFIQQLVNHGHQLYNIIKIIYSGATSIDNAAAGTHNRSITSNEHFVNDNALYIHWRYHPHDISRRTISNVYNHTLNGNDGFSQMRIAMSRQKNHREILCQSQLDPNHTDKVSDILQSLTYQLEIIIHTSKAIFMACIVSGCPHMYYLFPKIGEPILSLINDTNIDTRSAPFGFIDLFRY
jgi:hypothetical protein